MVTRFLDCSNDAKFVKSLVLPKYAVETIVEKKLDKSVAQKVALVASIDPYVDLYTAPITTAYNLDSSVVSTSTSSSIGGRRLPCTTCSCYCADGIGVTMGCNCRRRRLGASNAETLSHNNLEEERNLQTTSTGNRNSILPGYGSYTAAQFYKTVDQFQSTNQCKAVLSSVQYQIYEIPTAGLFL